MASPTHSSVLVAERDPLLRWALAETVQDCGFDVVSVDDLQAVRWLTDAQVGQVAAMVVAADEHTDDTTFAGLHARFPQASLAVMARDTLTSRDRSRLGIAQVFVKPFDLGLVRQYLAGIDPVPVVWPLP